MAADEDRALIGHLLRRGGFGASGPEIDAGTAAGYEATLDALFAPVDDPGADATAPPELTGPAIPAPGPAVTTSTSSSAAAANATTAARLAAAHARTTAESNDLTAWWLARMTAATRPWTEKRTFFWHGHFATSIGKVASAPLMLGQNGTLRSLGGGDFRILLRAVFTDPATMLWLDASGDDVGPSGSLASSGSSGSSGAAGSAGAPPPNENLARECMEHFTLGVGNYTELDVRQAALALTGWHLDRTATAATAVFDPGAHAPGPETILGTKAAFDVDSYNDLLTSTPAHARFLATRMWFRFGGGETVAPPAVLDRLTAAYAPNRDLTALARAVFTDPVFTAVPVAGSPAGTATDPAAVAAAGAGRTGKVISSDSAGSDSDSAGSADSASASALAAAASARYALVKQPVEYVVGALRALRITPPTDGAAPGSAVLRAALGGLGQLPFHPPSVGGWPAGQAWLTTAALAARISFARWAAANGDFSVVADAAPASRIDAAAYLLGVDAFSDRTRAALSDVAAQPAALVEYALLSPEYLIN